jgi:hypothetical protein
LHRACKGAYIQSENSDERVDRDIAQILKARGLSTVDAANIEILPATSRLNVLNDAHFNFLRMAAREFRYVVFDPLYSQMGGADVSDRSGDIPEVSLALHSCETTGWHRSSPIHSAPHATLAAFLRFSDRPFPAVVRVVDAVLAVRKRDRPQIPVRPLTRSRSRREAHDPAAGRRCRPVVYDRG